MDNQAKLVTSFGAGVLVGKIGGNLGWWLLGGITAYMVLKSPTARSYISKSTKSIYSDLTSK